jgi:hypothetical protein
MRLCPTRIDGAQTLVAHTITQAICQARQREHYHKCPACRHSNARAAEREQSAHHQAADPEARQAV